MTQKSCIVLIGMAACGKSTVGRELAASIGLAHLDTDNILEATYGACLQDISDALGKDAFLNMESSVICSLNLRRTVISTGGSVVYREKTMKRLSELGPIIHLDVPLPIILERIARKPDRGLAIAPGQTIEDLFRERELLYRHWAEYSPETGTCSVRQSVDTVLEYLRNTHPDICEVPEDAPLPPIPQN